MEQEMAGVVRRELFGLSLDALTIKQAVARCVESIEHGQYLSIGVVNAAKVMRMQRDAALARAVADCDMVLADGQSVVWASHLLRAPVPERVAGIDLFIELLAEADRRGYRVYFLGAKPDVLERMLAQASQRFPALKVAGSHDGYFSADEEGEIAANIRGSRADLLFLGMSSPKKEVFVSRWGQATGVRVIHGVGGSFDILAGVTTRAPARLQRWGLEWLYRAWQEPVRLGPRYLSTNLTFMGLVAREAAKTVGRRPASGADQGPGDASTTADAGRARWRSRTRR